MTHHNTLLGLACLFVAFSLAADTIAADKMYWSDRGQNTIMRADLDGSNYEILVEGLGQARGVAVDHENGMLYWADNGADKIQRGMIDGSNVQDLVSDDLVPPEDQLAFPAGVALDVPGGKVYWADASRGRIQRANLDGSNVEDFVTEGQVAPYFVTTDLVNQHLYWTDQGAKNIQRINLDGTNHVTLVSTDLPLPRGVDVDLDGGKMYWADRSNDVVQRSDLDGKNVETLNESSPSVSAPHGVAVDERRGHVYWLDNGLVTLKRMDLDGNNVETIYDRDSGTLTTPWQITLDLRHGTTCNEAATTCDAESQAARIDELTTAIRDGSNDLQFDINRDANVDAADRDFLIEYILNTLPGDSDLDGYFSSSDFVTAFRAGNYEKGIPDSATWTSGDWNGDGQFTTNDFVAAFQSGRYEEPQLAVSVVPEPSSQFRFVILATLVASHLWRQRRRAQLINNTHC